VAVWDEVCRRNDSSRDVESVADELMRRVARNVDLIVERLDAAGWRAVPRELVQPGPMG
jgi:hypothetical protein